jgi:septum formation protein
MVGRRILQKAKNSDEQRFFMTLLSGRRHRVLTYVCLYDPKRPQNKISQRIVSTLVQMKKLTEREIEEYVSSRTWEKCAGYRFDWMFQSFVKRLDGSVSSIAGLPVYEVRNLLVSAGYLVPLRAKSDAVL